MSARRGAARLALAAVLGLGSMSTTCTSSGGGSSDPEAIRTDRSMVDAKLQEYSELVVAMDHTAIASLFLPEGELVNEGAKPVHGPDAIDKYLRRFSDYHVLSNRIAATRTTVHGDTARQFGTWTQRVRTPKGETLDVAGRFEATWLRARPREWKILRLGTRPASP